MQAREMYCSVDEMWEREVSLKLDRERWSLIEMRDSERERGRYGVSLT